jgi:hypothetical protein
VVERSVTEIIRKIRTDPKAGHDLRLESSAQIECSREIE